MKKTPAQLTFILGGARSGKSSYAQNLALRNGGRVLYVATAEPGDQEMAERIKIHRCSRPETWATLEAPRKTGRAVLTNIAENKPDLILLDCLTMWVSNLLMEIPQTMKETGVQGILDEELEELISAYRQSAVPWIVVSNEVGLALVPEYPLGRVYRDALGWVNQKMAAAADEVLFMVAGIPMVVKKKEGL